MLAVPAIILMLAAGVLGGLAIRAQRLGSLISTHHYLATPTIKTGNNPPERDAFRQ